VDQQQITKVLPALYSGMFPPFFSGTIPAETLATCGNCAMAAPDSQGQNPEYYRPELKCCTYFPGLPNYLVGGILSAPSLVQGKARITARINGRTGVTPFGIFPSRKRQALYQHGRQGFGRSQFLLCPYLDRESGSCTIWPFRDAVCSTFYCKHAAGIEGKLFWNGMKDYLSLVEQALSQHVLRELGWDPAQLRKWNRERQDNRADQQLTARDLDDAPPDDAEWRGTWGAWTGTVEEFYIEAYRRTGAVDARQLRELGGVFLAVGLDNLELLRKEMLEPVLPDPLQRAPELKVTMLGDGKVRLISEEGPFEVAEVVYRVLDLFDGRTPTRDVLKAAAEKFDVAISPDFLVVFYHNRLLAKPK